MQNKMKKALVAVAGILGASLLSGCGKKPIEAVYGVPADITVKNSNESFSQYIGYNKDINDIKALIEKIEFENEYNGGQKESTMTDDIVYPIIKYTGPSVEELDKEAFYIVKIEKYNESGFISEISVKDEMDL